MTKIGDREIDTPELDKMATVTDKSQAVGEFVDWLREEKEITFAVRHEHEEGCESFDGYKVCGLTNGELIAASLPSMNQLLAEFFQIDLNKIERERRAILDAIRAEHDARA